VRELLPVAFALVPLAAVAAEMAVSSDVRRMDELWAARATPGPMEELIALGEKRLREEPVSYDALWRIARAWWWIGHSTENLEVRKRSCSKAMEVAERAIALRPRGVEAQLAHGFAVGDYATSIGALRAVADGVASRFERAMLAVYEIDRDHDHGSAMVALGRYCWRLPWPLRDLERSRRYLEEARERHPRNLTGRLYLAETYRDLGDDEKARAELEYVASREPLPERAPQDAPARGEATRRLAEWFAGPR